MELQRSLSINPKSGDPQTSHPDTLWPPLQLLDRNLESSPGPPDDRNSNRLDSIICSSIGALALPPLYQTEKGK